MENYDDAYKAILKLRREIEMMFRSIMSSLPVEKVSYEMPYDPPIDIIDLGEEIVVIMDLPGFDKDQIKIKVTEELLEIKALGNNEKILKDGKYLIRERFWQGDIVKKVKLPIKIKPHEVRAVLKNGILEVYMPKAQIVREVEVMVE